jgi:hypothetical protein
LDADYNRCAPRLHLHLIGPERRDLLLVRPPEHVSRAVIDPILIVFFVPLPPALDLSGARDRKRFPPELVERIAAGIVEPRGKFSVQPFIEIRVRLYREFVHQ